MNNFKWANEILDLINRKYKIAAPRSEAKIPYTSVDGRFDDWSDPDKICPYTGMTREGCSCKVSLESVR